jgi:hypothetical protein
VVSYDRQDRGGRAVDYYIIAPPPDEPGGLGPPRGLLMPGVLAEVGSMSLEAEGELLATTEGQRVAAEALLAAIADYIGERPLAVRYDLDVPGGRAGQVPEVAPGDGPLFWALSAPSERETVLILTNTGNQAWPSGLRLLVGLQSSDGPYLAAPPADLAPLDVDVPRLGGGESIQVEITLPSPPGPERHVAWLTLADGELSFDALGSAALQVAVE